MTEIVGESLLAVRDFAAQMGLPVRPARDGSLSFVFVQAGTLTLTAGEVEDLHVSLLRRPARVDAGLMRSALAAAGLDAASTRLVQAGLTGDDALIFSVRLAPGDVSLQSIEACLELLRRRQDALT